MLNYHELTMNEPRDSPARRKQFLVICAVMVSVLLHSAITAGALESVKIESESTYFPGGEFLYKPLVRDYAATGGMLRSIAEDVGAVKDGGWGAGIAQGEGDVTMGGVLFAVYLDSDSGVQVGERRFLTGALLGCAEGCIAGKDADELRQTLLAKNEGMKAEADMREKGEWQEYVSNIPYEAGKFPRAPAAVTRFPYTGGFVSALVHQFKVFPALVKYARAHGAAGPSVVISTTCSIDQHMCTHYAMLSNGDKFFLGRPDSDSYLSQLNAEKEDRSDSLSLAWKGLKKLLGLKKPSKKDSSEEL